MKTSRVGEGKFAEIKLDDGKRIFLSVLPDRITASTMFLFFTRKKIWEFIFPFYIRTAREAWDTSKRVLALTLEAIEEAKDLDELAALLERDASMTLRAYVRLRGEEAKQTAVDKVGLDASKDMLGSARKDFLDATIVSEYGAVLEEVSLEAAQKYPAAVYRQSLLPYPKEVIREALEAAHRSSHADAVM